jgi:hypothetical protein
MRPPQETVNQYVYEADGLGTQHYSPFLYDTSWQAAYDLMVEEWFPSFHQEVRWRMWTLTEHARRVDGLGAFAEFGVYRGGCAYMILSCTETSPYNLFDTFAGIPDVRLTATEAEAGFAGRLADTSVDYVEAVLAKWSDRTRFHAGDIFETLRTTETGPLALAHIDLNAALPTTRALQYAYPRLVRSGTIVFDDYGFSGYEEQRHAIDAFFVDTPDIPIALPTGQAIVVKT